MLKDWMFLFVSDNFPFNFIFTSDKFRISGQLYFIYFNQFIFFVFTSASQLGLLIAPKILLSKL